MNVKEISAKISELAARSAELEDVYIESGGEVNEITEANEAAVEAVRELLLGEGVDELGRWLRAKEDEKAALKAEKAYIDRRMKAVDGTIAYIKSTAAAVLSAAGVDKAKGARGYSFAVAESVTTSVDKEALNALYLERAVEAVRAAGVPAWVGLTLTASVKAVPEGEALPEVFRRETEETARFTKPRKAAED